MAFSEMLNTLSNNMEQMVNTVVGWVWSTPLVILCLGAGLFFSIRTRFLQLRHMKGMILQLCRGKASDKGISSFQGFCMALGGRVGTGNIAGVATAIAFGGPGALFWMWMLAFLGAGTAFIEAALGQVWKEKHTGEYRGGPSYYIERGLGMKWFAMVFAITTAFSCGLLMPGIQSNSIAQALENGLKVPTWASAVIVTSLLALVIFGGVKRIGRVAEILVPFMAIGYILMALIIVAIDFRRVPEIFVLIFDSAFGTNEIFGGIVGSAIAWGVKRGIYSNEAGQGTAPHAAAAAEVAHPAQQGLVQAFSVYVDTIGVCTATGLMILLTNTYNIIRPDGTFIREYLPGVEIGASFTQAAVDTIIPSFGSAFVAIALFFFAFTTIMAYAYYAESNVAYLARGDRRKMFITLVRIGLLVMTFWGCLRSASLMWAMGDIGVGLMAWLNLIAILALGGVGVKVLRDYERQLKNGEALSFDPESLGIRNTECWGKK